VFQHVTHCYLSFSIPMLLLFVLSAYQRDR
jgi:hypothetical protein